MLMLRAADSSLASGLHEVENLWTLEDLADATEFLDLKAEYQRRVNEEAKAKASHGRKR